MKKEGRTDPRIGEIQRFLLFALIFVVIIWALFGWALGIMHAPNADMYPRIDAGDLILYYRLDKDIAAHEVTVYEVNGNTLIGRVVAGSGDTVEVTEEGELMINGHYVNESGIFYSTPRYEGGIEYPVTLGEGEYFILADSREGGMDSRYTGPVSAGDIKGTVITVIRRNNF
ncbi:MAG TPA: signal peptidase I [Clostridiales bacterium]|nr:signal peptidase I [Clostridiales bacterium]